MAAAECWVLLYSHRNRRHNRDRSPGRPPQLSHSSWALYDRGWQWFYFCVCVLAAEWLQTSGLHSLQPAGWACVGADASLDWVTSHLDAAHRLAEWVFLAGSAGELRHVSPGPWGNYTGVSTCCVVGCVSFCFVLCVFWGVVLLSFYFCGVCFLC